MNKLPKIQLPTPLDNPDFSEVRELTDQYINDVINFGQPRDDDLEQYVFEEAVKAIYGKDVFSDLRQLRINREAEERATAPYPRKLSTEQLAFVDSIRKSSGIILNEPK